jgi:hypothetical protein
VRTAAITYGLTMSAASICFMLFWFYAASGRRLIAATVDQSVVTSFSRSTFPGLLVNAGATVVALWSPYAALALFAGTALFFVVGSSLFGND